MKKIKNLLIVFIFFGCSNKKYLNVNEVAIVPKIEIKDFYIVDTINIIKPIKIFSIKYGGEFITTQENLQFYKGTKEYFFREGIYLISDQFYQCLSQDELHKYNYMINGGCSSNITYIKYKDLEVYEYSTEKMSLVIGLISANFYWKVHSSYNYFNLGNYKDKNAYYKLAFPVCDK
ncbi:MAG TPA: hypothetical protein PK006_13270 [Saprospiraceae bacterium]|nr:hypothetical protein [Saprospiraceae bacterium]